MDYKKLPRDMADKLKQAQMEGNLTRSPDVNNLIRVAQGLKEGKVKPDVFEEELRYLYTLHENMVTAFDFLSRTQPATEVSRTLLPVVVEELKNFKEALDEINLYLEDNNMLHIEQGIEKLIETTGLLLEASDRLKEDEEKIETYSDSPMLSELIRIGKGVAKGIYDAENLRKRVDFAKSFHKSAHENMKQLMNESYDTKEAEEEAPLIMEALELMNEGFDELEAYFEDLDPEHILEGIEMIRQASEELSSSYKILMNAVEEADKIAMKQATASKEKVCFKCGLKLNINIKICPKCHIPIPDIKSVEEEPDEPTTRIDVAESTDVVVPMMTPNVKKIYDTAVAYIQDKISDQEFINTLDWFDNILRQSEETLRKEKLPELKDDREREIMEQTKQLFEIGIKESKAGIAEMRLYIKDKNSIYLENGMLEAIRGGEKLYQVQMIAKKIQQHAKEMKEKMKERK